MKLPAFAVTIFALMGAGVAVAQEAAPEAPAVTPLSLELNSAAEVEGGGCRLTYVATNGNDALGQVSYEVAVFNAEGIVSRILVLEFGALSVGKTKVVQFDLPDQGCGDIAKIVVNDVASCTLEDGSQGDFCLTGLTTNSRAPIQFGL